MKNPFKREPDPFAASRYEGIFRSVRTRERRMPWIFRHRWAGIALLLVGILVGMAGYGVYFYYHLQGQIQDDIPTVRENEEDQAPFNVLLVGSDSREGLTEQEQLDFGAAAVGGERADTIIVAHIDPETNRIMMVQFPRDLYVPIAGNGSNKINSALEGGPDRLVRTVKALTGLDINHYAQVNIAGFRDVIDAIGGVELCITEPIPFDPQTGIEVPEEELPLVEFDGERALRFVRSRNYASGDFERIRNQQRFLSAAINKVTSVGTLLSFGRIRKLADAAGSNLRIDKGTNLRELYDIGQRFRAFDPRNYEAYTAPNLGIGNNEAGSVVLPDEVTIEVMFDAIADNESPAEADGVPDIDVASVSVSVLNGTLEAGVAATAADELRAATTINGATVEIDEVAIAERSNFRRTIIRFAPDADDVEGSEKKAQLVAAAIPDARVLEVEENAMATSADVEIVIGRQPVEIRKIVQIVPIPLPKPGEVPAECR
ncbi:MAG TPA: LCP family protein [Actinomycetota bacterium]|nr:LCP family protein [Actinomycetota bacterium]